jgi:tol-pal system protein YbgF
MTIVRPCISGVLGLMFLAGTPFLFAAENPVAVETLSNEEVPFQAPVEEDSTGTAPMSAGETQYQLQLLQQDVQQLRGLVEELSHQLKQMQTTQEDRYLELDGRFQRLQQEMQSIARPAPRGDTEGGAGDIADVTQEEDVQSGGGNEQALYETALELIRNRQYDLAITQLQAVIAQYPDGAFTANAYYWLGEVYAAKPKPDYEKARQALAQVMTYFPNNRKVPDAAFKLAKVYHLMGDCDRARELLNQIIKDYQGKSVAKLAQSYLRDKVHCEDQ